MKSILFGILSIFICSAAFSATDMQFTVKKMHCSMCHFHIKQAFKKDPKINAVVKDVKIDLAMKKVNIEFKAGKSLDKKYVARVLDDAGYTPEELKKL